MVRNDPRLSDLLVEWELRRQEGTPVTPEDLCGHSPELLEPLRRLIREQEFADNLLGLPDETASDTETRSRVSVLMRYADLRLTARGGQSEILLAEDEELRRPIAVKVIKSEHMPFAKTRADFLREAEVTSRLEHPGIVPVHGVGRMPDGRPCYSMRYVKGQTLREAIKEFHDGEKPGRDPAERSLALRALLNRFIAVCNTIAYAHSRGILHRDIKPENIMLGKFGETLVLDWGLAKEVRKEEELSEAHGWQSVRTDADENATAQGQAIGTPSYMSPEQAAGRWDQVGPASDVFSLGATLYAILTGRAPYHGKSVKLVIEKAKACEFDPPRAVKRDVPRALEAICLKGMGLQCEKRYSSADALARDVENWLADERVSSHFESIGARMRRWARRHRTLVVGSSIGLLSLLVFLIVVTILVRLQNDALNGKNADLNTAYEVERKTAKTIERIVTGAVNRADSGYRIGNLSSPVDGTIKAMYSDMLENLGPKHPLTLHLMLKTAFGLVIIGEAEEGAERLELWLSQQPIGHNRTKTYETFFEDCLRPYIIMSDTKMSADSIQEFETLAKITRAKLGPSHALVKRYDKFTGRARGELDDESSAWAIFRLFSAIIEQSGSHLRWVAPVTRTFLSALTHPAKSISMPPK